jgi:hypothetical protein
MIKYDAKAIIQLIYDVNSTGAAYDNRQLAIMMCL